MKIVRRRRVNGGGVSSSHEIGRKQWIEKWRCNKFLFPFSQAR